MDWYLNDFTFQVPIGWELFAISMGSWFIVDIGNDKLPCIKAAMINPAETLKYE